jgi:general stress protein 26
MERHMQTSPADDRRKIWELIKGAHSALLVSIAEDGSLDSRPMGCLQSEFDGTLWFLTFRHSGKVAELKKDSRVLVSYVRSSKYEYVSVSGRARLVDDRDKIKELWTEGLRVWFPNGPGDPEIALISVGVEVAKYWTDPASVFTYALAYVKARVTGETPSPDEIVNADTLRFR